MQCIKSDIRPLVACAPSQLSFLQQKKKIKKVEALKRAKKERMNE